MALLDRLFKTSKAASFEVQRPCRHPELAAMWDSVADMGERDKITRYRCLNCQIILPAAQVQLTAHQMVA